MDCNFDARLVSKCRRIHQTEKARLLSKHFNASRRVQPQPGPLKRLLSVIIAHLWALKVIANSKLGDSPFTKFRAACYCVAPCPCFASRNCCHDPFIVRHAQTCPPLTGFTYLAHPSRFSGTTLITARFSAHASPRVSLCSHQVCNTVTRSIISCRALIL